MKMTESEALSLIGSLLMRMMGVLLVIADCVVANDKQRDYFKKQRDWYVRTQDLMEICEAVDDAMEVNE